MSTEEFLLLPFTEVDELISNTLLNVDMEEKVYSSVINWVKHEPSERKKFVARVSLTLFFLATSAQYQLCSRCILYLILLCTKYL